MWLNVDRSNLYLYLCLNRFNWERCDRIPHFLDEKVSYLSFSWTRLAWCLLFSNLCLFKMERIPSISLKVQSSVSIRFIESKQMNFNGQNKVDFKLQILMDLFCQNRNPSSGSIWYSWFASGSPLKSDSILTRFSRYLMLFLGHFRPLARAFFLQVLSPQFVWFWGDFELLDLWNSEFSLCVSQLPPRKALILHKARHSQGSPLSQPPPLRGAGNWLETFMSLFQLRRELQ